MATDVQELIEKLDHMQIDLAFIKKRLVDVDLVLTSDDLDALQQAEEDLKHRQTTRLV